MTVDEILAQREYRDRRGRRFGVITSPSESRGEWLQWWPEIHPYPDEILSPDQMRLLIERDMHRDECGGGRLADCIQHPVPSVTRTATGEWGAYGALCSLSSSRHATFPAAMGAARALAVSSE